MSDLYVCPKDVSSGKLMPRSWKFTGEEGCRSASSSAFFGVKLNYWENIYFCSIWRQMLRQRVSGERGGYPRSSVTPADPEGPSQGVSHAPAIGCSA